MKDSPRFKVDENLPQELTEYLQLRGLDALSVYDQRLGGEPDGKIWEVCRKEGRVLVTLDVDFANILAYPPEDTPGIIVLRYLRQDKSHVMENFSILVEQLGQHVLAGRLCSTGVKSRIVASPKNPVFQPSVRLFSHQTISVNSSDSRVNAVL